ncbi:MAG: pantetheine-phosphate adenylyltransferase [Kiritimatiellia bacterium]|jgi:pantetheine-phosphate adenylyltransferase|nr:pantetheine-phosphate adenylyltransferase [Kiritimatiellia bacterium]
MNQLAIYAGTFDPMTLGHWDLIERSAEIFQNLILGVTTNPAKDPMFSTEERMDMARDVVKGLENVEVDTFEGLLIDYAKLRGSRVLIRGLRAYSDFEYEFQMALTNRKLAPEIETLFMMPKEIHSYVSSSTVREVARFGGDVSEFVPSSVLKVIGEKLGHGGAG